MKNSLFVESINDQVFVEAVVNRVNTTKKECHIDDYFPKSIDKVGNNLKEFIKSKLREVIVGQINKIGILIDLDDFLITERLNYVNNAIQQAIKEELNEAITIQISAENQLQTIEIQENTVDFACYFMKIGNRGHLDTVLKTIANKPSDYADCLYNWQICVEGKNLKYDQNQYEKFWVNTYINLDTCQSSAHRGNKEKYCSMKNFEQVIKKNIFNLDHECLVDLKTFLKLFN
jgi:hypothetical protein